MEGSRDYRKVYLHRRILLNSDVDPDRIRIRIYFGRLDPDPDSDPGGEKWLTKKEEKRGRNVLF